MNILGGAVDALEVRSPLHMREGLGLAETTGLFCSNEVETAQGQ